MKNLYFVCALITLPLEAIVVNLVDSTAIVQALIKKDQLEQILDDSNLQVAQQIVANYAPSEIAFECEVNQTTVPLVLLYFFEEPLTQGQKEELESIDQNYDEQIKIVLIDNKQLPLIAQRAEIKNYPTVLSIKEGMMLEYQTVTNIEQISKMINDLLCQPAQNNSQCFLTSRLSIILLVITILLSLGGLAICLYRK